MSDIICPYCEHEQEVCHDGESCAEGEAHQMECNKCEKSFVFTTEIIFCYSPIKADCLNDGKHEWWPTRTHNKQDADMICADCDARRKPTADEMQEIRVGYKL